MLRLSWFTILVIVCSGCSFHIDEYKRLRNVDVTILGESDHERDGIMIISVEGEF